MTSTTRAGRPGFRRRHEARTGWMFLAPFVVLFLVCFVAPIVVSVREALFKKVPAGGGLYGGGQVIDQFVGLENILQVLSLPALWSGLGRVVAFGSVDFFAPGVMLGSMANMTTWTFTGYNMLIFLAALQAIPRDIYEAARIDGASDWRIIWSIKIPLVAPAALLAILLSIIGTVQLFNEPTVLATVNPWMGNDYTPMMLAYNAARGLTSPGGGGIASAVSLVMAVFAGVLAGAYALLQSTMNRSR